MSELDSIITEKFTKNGQIRAVEGQEDRVVFHFKNGSLVWLDKRLGWHFEGRKEKMLTCRMCGEQVKNKLSDLRDHLEGHHSGAADFSAEQVRDQFQSDD